MTNGIRQAIERAIALQFVKDALAAGYRLAVSLERGYDLGEMLLGSRDESAIMDAMFAGDECHVFIQSADGPTVDEDGVTSLGWVYFVLGNDGYDVISDYQLTKAMEKKLMKNAEKLSERIESGEFTIQAQV